MNLRKHLLATARLVLPTVGLGLICVGAYVNSLQEVEQQLLREIFTYMLIMLGFILLVLGVLWSVGHGVKGVLVKWSEGRMRHNDVQVFTVDRANFPPSYEESQVRTEAAEDTGPVPVVPGWHGLAPPVYTENFQTCTEDFSHEDPPTYHQATSQNQNQNQNHSHSLTLIQNQNHRQNLNHNQTIIHIQSQNQVAPTNEQAILQNQNQLPHQTTTSQSTNISIETF